MPGPIGSILAPTGDAPRFRTLPFACSMCGSCTDVCPVKIPLHHQLLALRREIVAGGLLPWPKRLAMRIARLVMAHPWWFRLAGAIPRRLGARWTGRLLALAMPAWGKQREFPPLAPSTFRQLYRRRRKP